MLIIYLAKGLCNMALRNVSGNAFATFEYPFLSFTAFTDLRKDSILVADLRTIKALICCLIISRAFFEEHGCTIWKFTMFKLIIAKPALCFFERFIQSVFNGLLFFFRKTNSVIARAFIIRLENVFIPVVKFRLCLEIVILSVLLFAVKEIYKVFVFDVVDFCRNTNTAGNGYALCPFKQSVNLCLDIVRDFAHYSDA